ncbi:MAG: GGDEF domain-containing protein [Spirochaetales bacterium]|nr:GGDEF domain-containing protein [Spirochaetales bacterium]
MTPLNERPTIGFMTNNVSEDGFAAQMWPGIMEKAKDLDVNVIAFPGDPLNAPDMYGRQMNRIYNYVNDSNIDAVIIASGMLSYHIGVSALNRFVESLKPLPVVSISEKLEGTPSILVNNTVGMKNAVSHLIEIHGIRRIAFIKGVEGVRDADERFAAYREVLQDYGIAYNEDYVFQGNFIAPSGIEAVNKFVRERDVRPGAIVAANDDMAYGAMEQLRRLKIEVPKQMALTGFDNNRETEFLIPPLTTVRQPVYEQAVMAVDMAVRLLRGEEVPEKVLLPTELMVRSSCGCIPRPVTLVGEPVKPSIEGCDNIPETIAHNLSAVSAPCPVDKSELQTLTRHLMESSPDNPSENFLESLRKLLVRSKDSEKELMNWQRLIILLRNNLLNIHRAERGIIPGFLEDSLQMADIMVGDAIEREQLLLILDQRQKSIKILEMIEQLSRTLNMDVIFNSIKNKIIPATAIRYLFLSLYDLDAINEAEVNGLTSARLHLRIACRENEDLLQGKSSITYPSRYIIPKEYLPRSERFTMILLPLFFMEDQFGIFLFEYGDFSWNLYNTLWHRICTSLKSSLLFSSLTRAESKLLKTKEELEKSNNKLETISQRDELTGLLNRRGFLTIGSQNLDIAANLKKSGHMLFIDMDGLKAINDSHGHDEGDNALVQTARILETTFRETDIIARLGGDEFVVLTIDTNEPFIEVASNRLKKNIKIYNQSSAKPYALSLSFGFIFFNDPHARTIESLLKEADQKLYEQKKIKKTGTSGE